MIIPGSKREAATERYGPLSTLTEWHAFLVGLAVGVVAALANAPLLAALFVLVVLVDAGHQALEDVRKEPWHSLGGLLVGLAGVVFL